MKTNLLEKDIVKLDAIKEELKTSFSIERVSILKDTIKRIVGDKAYNKLTKEDILQDIKAILFWETESSVFLSADNFVLYAMWKLDRFHNTDLLKKDLTDMVYPTSKYWEDEFECLEHLGAGDLALHPEIKINFYKNAVIFNLYGIDTVIKFVNEYKTSDEKYELLILKFCLSQAKVNKNTRVFTVYDMGTFKHYYALDGHAYETHNIPNWWGNEAWSDEKVTMLL